VLLCSNRHGQHDITKTLRQAMQSAATCMHRVLTGNVDWSGRIGSLPCLTFGCCVCCAGRRCGIARARRKESGTAQQGCKAHHCFRWALGRCEPKDRCSSCQRHAGRQGCWRASMFLVHPEHDACAVLVSDLQKSQSAVATVNAKHCCYTEITYGKALCRARLVSYGIERLLCQTGH